LYHDGIRHTIIPNHTKIPPNPPNPLNQKMYTARLLLSSLIALTATVTATPVTHHKHKHAHPRSSDTSDTFSIEICNQCPGTKHFGMYQITSAFQMLERMDPLAMPSNTTQTISAPFKDTGMRISAHAEKGVAAQWENQALFEFGYSQYNGLDGTAYDVSIMEGSDDDVGVAVYPTVDGEACEECPSKVCSPGNCAASQGWTQPDQETNGSPADTVCYKGKAAFKVVFCP
jgi:hypothetical protein